MEREVFVLTVKYAPSRTVDSENKKQRKNNDKENGGNEQC